MLASAAVVVAIVAALGGRTVYDNVKPFGFQDPNSDSSRAYEDLRDATGERPIPEVELLVRPSSGDPSPAASLAAEELRSVHGIQRVVTPETEPGLVSVDRRMALVLGFISADITDISKVGTEVKGRFSNDPEIVVGGAAVTVDELTKTTQDDLQRIELYALPLLLLLSFLVFRGSSRPCSRCWSAALSILTTLLLLNALTTVVDIDTFAINIVTGLGLGLAIDYSLFLVTRFREELERSDAVEASLVATTAAIGRMVVFSGMTVAVSLIALCIFPQRFLYSIGIGGALVALSSAAVCLLFLPALLAMLGERVNALAPARCRACRANDAGRYRALRAHPSRRGRSRDRGHGCRRPALPSCRAHPGQRRDPARGRKRTAGRRCHRRALRRDPADRIVVVASNAADADAALSLLRGQSTATATRSAFGPRRDYRVDAQLAVDPSGRGARHRAAGALESWAESALIDGPPAELVDQRQSLGAHLPSAIAIHRDLDGAAALRVTRSVVLPFFALLMNALTVGVAFGVLVFSSRTDGWRACSTTPGRAPWTPRCRSCCSPSSLASPPTTGCSCCTASARRAGETSEEGDRRGLAPAAD